MAEETAKLIAAVTEYLRQAVELGKTEVPLLVQEYLRWAFVTSVVYSVLGLVLVVGALAAFRWAHKQPRDASRFGGQGELSTASLTANTLAAIGGGSGLLMLSLNTYELMYVWLAPRAYMLWVLKRLVS